MVTDPAQAARPAGREEAERGGSAWRTAAFLALPLAAAGWRFAPITRNFFFGDDLLNYFQIVNLGSLAHLVIPYSGHSLFTRNLIFQALFRLFGPDPAPCFALALATHLVNVGLLFAVIRVYTQSDRLASFGALLWGTAPVNEHAVGWFAVYGQTIATLAALWILLDLGRVARGGRLGRAAPARWIALLLAASTSFGIGIAFAITLPIAALLLVPSSAPRRRVAGWLAVAALLVVAFYLGLGALASRLDAERTPILPMLSGVLRFELLLRLVLGLLAYAAQSLLLNVIGPRFAFPDPVTVAAAIAGLAVVAGALAAGSPAARRTIVAVLLVAVAGYGLIALGRVWFAARSGPHLVTSVGRYHYAGPALLAVVLCVALATLARFATPVLCRASFAVAAALLVAGQLALSKPIDNHDGNRAITQSALTGLRQAIRSAPPGADVYIENEPFFGVGPLLVANPRFFPGMAALYTIFFPENVFEGRRVRFVESRYRMLHAWRGKGRIGELLVAPQGQKTIRVPR